jgi:hypothetical protein
MQIITFILLCFASVISVPAVVHSQTPPDEIKFVRQGVRRMIFDEDQSIPLASLNPANIIDLSVMHPVDHYSEAHSQISIDDAQIRISSLNETETAIWFGGFNPFATYTMDISNCTGEGAIGFEFSDATNENRFIVAVAFEDSSITGTHVRIVGNNELIAEEDIAVNLEHDEKIPSRIMLQMLGSGLVLYAKDMGLPKVIGQSDFNKQLDLRKKEYISTFQSSLYVQLQEGKVRINKVEMALTTGVGLADIRAMTYENGDPLLDQGRLWYTMSIRGRALPHHIQGVFSMYPTLFDLQLEGVILFDRNDGILRNEIASHIFYDRVSKVWRGMTTGFSAFANPEKEEKQLLAIESMKDPRFGFSIMHATPFGIVGDIEDPHIIFDEEAEKWRILTCENHDGYKAVVLESDHWNKDYQRISGPVDHNSTGTSIQKIGGQFYCFSGSSERNIFIYSYPDLREIGTLQMDLPPWSKTSGNQGLAQCRSVTRWLSLQIYRTDDGSHQLSRHERSPLVIRRTLSLSWI